MLQPYNSSTVITGNFDDTLWSDVMAVTENIYSENLQIPSKLHAEVQPLKKKLCEFSRNSDFVAEIPSLRGKPCTCCNHQHTSTATPFKQHSKHEDYSDEITCEYLVDVCENSLRHYDEAYNLLRRPAKEVLVAVVSDLDRNPHSEFQHAVPIAYYMTGFSLKMHAVRHIISDLITLCETKGLQPKVVAFDGQITEIATQDQDQFPLTVLKLQKKVWKEVRSLTRKEILDRCIDLCLVKMLLKAALRHTPSL